jgi:hypothetical protein
MIPRVTGASCSWEFAAKGETLCCSSCIGAHDFGRAAEGFAEISQNIDAA